MNLKRITYCVSFAPATVLLGAAVALAQAPGAPQQPGGAGSQMPSNPGTGSPGMPNNNPGMNNPGNAPTGQDYAAHAFVSKAMEGDLAEVQLGQLAQQKSQSNDVKQFAQKMVSEHQQMNDKWFEPEAKQMGVSEPKGPSKKDKKEMAKLESLSGPDFDREYLTMMVKDHQKDLKEFKEEANSAQDPALKQIAQKGADVIAQHLQLAEQVAKAHNVNVDENGKEMSSNK